MPKSSLDPGSFRDRDGRVFYHDGRVCRALSADALSAWQRLSDTRFFPKLMESGAVVGTRRADDEPELLAGLEKTDGASWVAALEHERIPFISYPYEWCFGMLRDAALGQLDLLTTSLAEDFVLKDASPYNTQWIGARQTFIDVASFEPRRAGDPWAGYLQFCRLFLYPLLLTAYRHLPFQPWLRADLDGIPPEEMAAILNRWRDRLRPGVFKDVYLQAALHRRQTKLQRRELQTHKPRKSDDPDSSDDPQSLRREMGRAGFGKEMILANVGRLRKIVRGLQWRQSESTWADYHAESSYDAENRGVKEDFVRRAAAARPLSLVWDLGCNTGHFSRIAAETADYVIAMDADHLAIERLYGELKSDSRPDILPLVANLASPSPGLGWRLRERRPLEDRGRPDLVLALALIHHLVLSANIPLPDLVDWLIDLGADLVIEFVTKDDPMVRRLLRNQVDTYDDYDPRIFEDCLAKGFETVDKLTFHHGTRTLYHLKNRRH